MESNGQTAENQYVTLSNCSKVMGYLTWLFVLSQTIAEFGERPWGRRECEQAPPCHQTSYYAGVTRFTG